MINTAAIPLSSELLLNLVQSAGSGIVVTDASLPENPIVFANQAFYSVTGYSEAETIGFNCKFLQGEDKAQPDLERLKQAIRKKESCRVTLRNYKKDGTMFWNELYITPHFDQEEKVSHFIGIQNDVTAAVEQRQQREMYNAGLIHDIKGPLFGQARIPEYLTKQDSVTPMTFEAHEIMLSSLKTSLSLINDTLAHYKLENRLVAPKVESLSARKIFARVIESAQESAAEKQVKLTTVEPGGECFVTADQDMLFRALKNLVDNAIKSSARGKTVWLFSATTVTASILAVLDEGPGLPAALKAALIKDFSQMQSAFTSQNRESTGLGLMTCAQIMRIHGGTLTLLKSDHSGTDLALVFPL